MMPKLVPPYRILYLPVLFALTLAAIPPTAISIKTAVHQIRPSNLTTTHLTLMFTQFNAPVSVDTSRFLLELGILQARVRVRGQEPIHGDITYKADDEDPCNAIVLTVRPQAQLTWRSWYYAANGLLSFLERYEYVEFGYRLKNDEGGVLAVGELADLRSSAKARNG